MTLYDTLVPHQYFRLGCSPINCIYCGTISDYINSLGVCFFPEAKLENVMEVWIKLIHPSHKWTFP